MVTELKSGIYWVGCVDWGIRVFHGHELSTHRGTTYNAYLIKDEKTALVDSVWAPFREEFLANVRKLVDLSQIDYIVANHMEPDHSGALADLVRLCPRATLVVSKRGVESMEGHYHAKWPCRAVGTGDRIGLGRRELVFVEAPLLHWPDSMFTYVNGANVLLPNDAFGQHYATACRFNGEVDREELYEEALKYYANILTPFSDRVLKKIDELLAMNLPVDIIAPSHGVIWRDNPLQIVEQYRTWARQEAPPGVVVLYDTMWQATRRMAEAVGEGVVAEGVPCRLLHVPVTDRNDAVVEVFKARGVAFGSPTINRGIMATSAGILEDIRGHQFKNKVGAAFGSYGWSGEAVKHIEEILVKSGIPLAGDSVRVKWQPAEADLEKCRALGRTLAQKAKAG